jgi:UTP--glucose-1-phosphate uridylyltransferase
MIVTGRGKRAIEDHFDKSYELEATLMQKNKLDRLEEVQAISDLANIHYIRQKEPKGLGHAIWCARRFIGNEPFAVMLGDDVVDSVDNPCIQQLINVFNQCQASVVGVQKVADEDVSKYGIIAPKGNEIAPGVIPVASLIEKPALAQSPSNYAILGRYVLTPEIFDILEKLSPGAGGEIQLTDAIKQLNQSQEVFAYQFSGTRYDLGDKFGFIKATIDFALKREDLKEELLEYLQQISEK